MILDFIAALLVSALAATGVGGGGFFVIYLTLVRGTEQLQAQGINLFFFLFGALPGIIVHMFKRKINFGLVLVIGLSGVVGTFFGAFILKTVDPVWIRKAFGAMLVITGTISLFKKTKK